jgi:hypothetical protein
MSAHYLSDEHQQILLLIISESFKPEDQQLQTQKYIEVLSNEHNDLQESVETSSSACAILNNDVTRLTDDVNNIKTNLEQHFPKIDELKKQDNENGNGKSCKDLLDTHDRIEVLLDTIKKIKAESQILTLDTNSTATLPFAYRNTSSFSITSSKVQTSEYGYIFMVRLCSTTESGKDYLSVFLTLCNGEYSNLIPYPFLYTIHLVLWDQSNQHKHIFQVVKPNPNSSELVRPTSEMNDEFGISKFCPLGFLTDKESIYVKDGVFFIRMFIDFLDTGKNPFQLDDNTQNIDIMTTTTMVTE